MGVRVEYYQNNHKIVVAQLTSATIMLLLALRKQCYWGSYRHSLSISLAGRGFAQAAGPRAESSDSAFVIGKPVTRRTFPSNVIACQWRESRDRAQLSRPGSRRRDSEEQGDFFGYRNAQESYCINLKFRGQIGNKLAFSNRL
jgi:hypothetical protein